MSLVEQAYQTIRDGIIHYQLKPGTNLRLDELAGALGMSQTPIREALNRLEREHLVCWRAQKGFCVPTMSLRDLEDIYELRTALEVLACQQAAERIDREVLAMIRQSLDRCEKHEEGLGKGRPVEEERHFHSLILEASGNRILCETGLGLLDRLWMIQNLNLISSTRLEIAREQHREIFEALCQGDAKAAGELMKGHITAAKQFVMARMQDTSDFFSIIVTGLADGLPVKPGTMELPKK